MPEKSSAPLDIEPWVEGPEIDEFTLTVNVMMWFVVPPLFAFFTWCSLWLMYYPATLVGGFYAKWAVRIGVGGAGFIIFLVCLSAPRFVLHSFQLNRLSARLRGFLLGAFPRHAPLVFFHTLFCVALLGAIAALGYYLFDLRGALAALASGLRRPAELFYNVAHGLYVISWRRLLALGYFYLLVFWLAEEIFFALRFEVSSARVEKVEGFQAARPAAPIARVAHLTDLHVTASDETSRVDGGPGGNAALRRALEELGRLKPEELTAVLITGDITDAGAPDEWRRFFEMAPAALLEKCVLVPGNHELNIPQGKGLRAAVEPQDQVERKFRAIRFVAAADRVQGARAFVADESAPDRPLRPLRDYLARHEETLQSFIDLARKGRLERKGDAKWKELRAAPYVVWDEIFPMVVEVPGTELRVLVLNSNDEGLDLLTNAYGLIGRSQLRRLRLMLPQLSGTPFVVAMHHHLGVQPVGKTFKDRVFERAMPLIDGGSLVKALGGEGCVVFNGHRHVSYFARIGGRIQIIAGPSTTLGDESGRRPRGELGFGVYELAWDAREGTSCLSERWLRLA